TRVVQVSVHEPQTHVFLVGILIEMVDARGVEARRASDQAVHLVALGEQKLSQVGAVLPGDSGDQCALHERSTVGKDPGSNNRSRAWAREARELPPPSPRASRDAVEKTRRCRPISP